MADGKEKDAFGLLTPRMVSDGEAAPAREAAIEPDPPKAVKPQMRLVPEKHRESFAHSSTWWQNNIEIYKHVETGRYLYLSREGEGESEVVKGYMYQGASHKFVEISVGAAIAMAANGELKAKKTA